MEGVDKVCHLYEMEETREIGTSKQTVEVQKAVPSLILECRKWEYMKFATTISIKWNEIEDEPEPILIGGSDILKCIGVYIPKLFKIKSDHSKKLLALSQKLHEKILN